MDATYDRRDSGSLTWGAIWMIVIPILLFWIPGIGGFIGGLVGGKVSGGVGRALMAWLLSSIIVGVLFAVAGTALTGMPIIGIFAGMTGLMLALVDSGARLLGAIVGGLIA